MDEEVDLNRLEDIYQDIKLDLLKVQKLQQQRRKKTGKKPHVLKDIQDFEEELDSQQGNTSDEDEQMNEVLEEAQEIEELKI